MKDTITKYAFLAIAAASAVPALAEDKPWYTSATVGVGSLESGSLVYRTANDSATADADFSASFAGGGTLGYSFDNGWSLEGEIMYRRNELDPVDFGALGSFEEGDFASLAFGINALYRFNFGDSGKWSAYAGPGIVYFQEIDIDFDNAGQQEISFESDDTALQLKLGTRYNRSNRLFFDASATYLAGSNVEMSLPSDSSEVVEADYNHWALSVGVGWRF